VLPPDELLLIVIWPLSVPGDAGSNCTCSVIDCCGFSVTGRTPPTIVNPAPVIVAELIVTGAVPVDVSVNVCIVAVLIVTLPKLRFAPLTVNCGELCGDVGLLAAGTLAPPPQPEATIVNKHAKAKRKAWPHRLH
jgi:hypothetical protein